MNPLRPLEILLIILASAALLIPCALGWLPLARTEVLGFEAADGIAVLTLLEAPVRPIAGGDGLIVRAGCDKRMETCGTKVANTANLRGFPHIPGQDAVLRYATKDGGHEGSVL